MCLRQIWGNITHNAVLKCGTRELDLVKTYTGHERDSVLGQYYAKARMYDTADKHGSTKGNKLGDKRFTAVDPVKGNVRNPQSLVQYTYVLNNPLMYVDPLGRFTVTLGVDFSAAFAIGGNAGVQILIDDNYNIGVGRYLAGGGGTPAVALAGSVSITNADTIFDLSGEGFSVGASGSIGIVSAGMDLITATTDNKETIMGVQITPVSVSTPWPELHGMYSYSWIDGINVPDFVEKALIDAVNYYFDTLNCLMKQEIESLLGVKLHL